MIYVGRVPTRKYSSVSGADGPQGYGELYALASTKSVSLSTAWTQISSSSMWMNGLSDAAITPVSSSGLLQTITAGVYKVDSAVSFSGSVSDNMEIEILINAATSLGNNHADRKLGTGGDIGAAPLSGLHDLSSGDTIGLYARSTSAAATITLKHANINMDMVAAS